MGGRGASSSGKGFSWTTYNGRKMTVEKAADGTVIINGEPNKLLNYNKLLEGAKKQSNFKINR